MSLDDLIGLFAVLSGNDVVIVFEHLGQDLPVDELIVSDKDCALTVFKQIGCRICHMAPPFTDTIPKSRKVIRA